MMTDRSEKLVRQMSVPATELRLISNWAESYAVDESKFRHPQNLDELKEIVATEDGIRVVGAMHSCAPLIESRGVIVSLEHFDDILDIDAGTKIARIQGGVVIHKLAEALAPHGLALGTLGTIDWQTVSGAVMTGTHGGSLTTPSLHTFIESYTILKADGNVVKVSRSEEPEKMAAMAPSNGVFGIVIELEIRCVALEYLAAKMVSIPFDEGFPCKFCDIMRSNKYCRIIVYPSLRCATVWTAKPVNKEDAIEEGATFSRDYVNFRSSKEKEWLEEFLARMEAGEFEKADDALRKVLESQLIRLKHYCGQYNHVLCKERNHGIPHADMEFGFEFDRAPEILSTLVEHFKTNRAPYYNFEMRSTQKDDAMLSCCHSRDTLWIDFQAKSQHMSDFFGSLEDLLAPYEYRKHWAKGMDHTQPDYLMRQYPRLGAFLALVDEFDPNGKFRNDHVDLWFVRTKRFCSRLSVRIKALIGMGAFRSTVAQEKLPANKK